MVKFLRTLKRKKPEAQRKSQDDPLSFLVQGPGYSFYEQIHKSKIRGRRYRRRKETKGKKVVTSLNFQEEVDTAAKGVNTAEGVNTGKGKAPMIIEEAPKKSKEQILHEEASLAEAIRLDTLQKEEEAKQVHLDSLLAQRIAEEEELNEQQKKRRAQVQFEAQHYTDEDWDLIRAKIEANAELSKSMLGSGLKGADFCKKMVIWGDMEGSLSDEFKVIEGSIKKNLYGLDGPEDETRERKLLKTLILDESRSTEFNLFSDLEEYSKEEVAEIMVETMEQYMSKTRADYGSGIARPKIDDKDSFELKG
ncbi:hypothetical protein Tco_0835159 [Tanacetum coccineum]